MTEEEKEKAETLEEWYSKVYDYDPSPEEASKCYSDEFNEKWKNFLKKCYSKEFFEKLKQI